MPELSDILKQQQEQDNTRRKAQEAVRRKAELLEKKNALLEAQRQRKAEALLYYKAPQGMGLGGDDDSDDDKAKIARDIKQTSDDDSIFLGLRVYTSKDAPAEICGQLRHEMELSATLAL